MITRSSYSTKPHSRIRSKPQGLPPPPGFSRPTVSSAARRSPPRKPATPADHDADASEPLPSRAATQSQPLPEIVQTFPNDARLDRDLVLAPYWYALREKGFESAAVLQALTKEQAMKALELCGVDKIGHRWYVLNKYCAPHPMSSSNGGTDEAGIRDAEQMRSPSVHDAVIETEAQDAADAEAAESRGDSPSTPGGSLPEPSSTNGAVLYRRLQRPKYAVRRRASLSPRRKRSTSPIGISKELLHPPEHYDAHDDDTAAPSHSAASSRGLLDAPQTPPPLLWRSIASPPIASLHDSATYKTLVSLLGGPAAVASREEHPRRSLRRRSASPPSPETQATSTWMVEAARRRFLAPTAALDAKPPAATLEKPLSPFAFQGLFDRSSAR